jgi:hypothetical protein
MNAQYKWVYLAGEYTIIVIRELFSQVWKAEVYTGSICVHKIPSNGSRQEVEIEVAKIVGVTKSEWVPQPTDGH